jgi:transposase-like protein
MSQNQSIHTNPNGTVPLDQPDPEVVVPAKRRQFTVADKLRILDEIDRCEPGQIGAVLRREGLYSSHLTKWRRQRADGQLQGRTSQRRGRKAEPQAAELAALRRENERLQAELEQARLIIEVQKKLCQLFGLPTHQGDGSN